MHEGVEVDKVLVAGTLTGEQTVGLRREGESAESDELKVFPTQREISVELSVRVIKW